MSVETLMQDAIHRYQGGDHAGAEELCKQALTENPNEAKAYRLLGIIAHKYYKRDLAQQLLAKAIEINPADIDAYIELGIAMKYGSELDPSRAQNAIEVFEMAFKIDPSKSRPLTMIVAVLIEHNNLDQALSVADLCVEVEPQSADSHCTRANILKLQGRTAEALSEYKIALLCDPSSTMALAGLSEISKHKDNLVETQQLVKQIKECLKNPLPRLDEINLHFALAKIYDEQADYGHAFKHLTQANDLKLKSVIYDISSVAIKAKHLLENFNPESLEAVKPNLEAYQGLPIPIFILGMPRSGSSLIEQILASHPDVYGAGELYAFPSVIQIPEDTTDSLQQCFDRFIKMSPDEITQLGLKYLKGLAKINKNSAKYVCDKLPSNFWVVPLIRAILPQAIIIHSERDAVDTCLSCYQQNFSTGHTYSFSLEGLGNFYNAYAKTMKLWNQHFAGHIYNLSYEALTSNQERETRKLLDYCGLDWDEKCMDFHKTKRSVITASTLQVREPIYKRSVKKWRNYEPYLRPLLDLLQQHSAID